MEQIGIHARIALFSQEVCYISWSFSMCKITFDSKVSLKQQVTKVEKHESGNNQSQKLT